MIRKVVLAPGAVAALVLTDMPALEQAGIRLYGTSGGRLEVRGTALALRKLLRRAWQSLRAGQRDGETASDYGARVRSLRAAISRIVEEFAAPCRPPLSRRAIAARLEVIAAEIDGMLDNLAAGIVPDAAMRDAMADRATGARQLASRLRSKGG